MSDNKRMVAEYTRRMTKRHRESKLARLRDRIAIAAANWFLVNVATEEYQFSLFWLYRVADDAMFEKTNGEVAE